MLIVCVDNLSEGVLEACGIVASLIGVVVIAAVFIMVGAPVVQAMTGVVATGILGAVCTAF